MAQQWFEASVRYEKVMDNGLSKKVTEPYLVDSLSFTESEERTIKEISPYIHGEYTIPAIKRSNISEVFDEQDGDYYWRVKAEYITVDEKSGLEKRTPARFLLKATSYKTVIAQFDKCMEGTLADYEVVKIEKTAIVDVIRHES